MNCFLLYHKKSKLQPVRMKIIIFFAKYLTNKFKTDFLRLLSQVLFIRLLCSLFFKNERFDYWGVCFCKILLSNALCILKSSVLLQAENLFWWRFEKFSKRDFLRQELLGELFYALSRRKRKQKTRLIKNLLFPSNTQYLGFLQSISAEKMS